METNPLDKLWGSSAEIKLLVFFFKHPKEEFYASEISDKTELSGSTVNKHLKSLAGKGLLEVQEKGRMNFYSLDRQNPVNKHLKIAYNLSQDLITGLQDFSKEEDLEIYLYGSRARGENIKGSDWDLLIIGDIKREKIEEELGKTDEEINYTQYTRIEWNQMEEDPAFYHRVEKDKIRIN